MGNSSLGSSSNVQCFDPNLSRDSVSPEFWDIKAVSPAFADNAIVTAFVILLFIIIGLPSNIIVIVSIIQQKLYREATHIMLLNLAISDALVCLLVMPLAVVAGFAGDYIFGNSDYVRCQVCQTGVIFIALTIFAVNILAAITLDRFMIFKFPLRYSRYVTASRVTIIVIILWIISIFESVLPLFGFGEVTFAFSLSVCTLNVIELNYVMMILLLNLIPVVIIIIFNIWIACIASKQVKTVYRTRRSFGNKEELRKYNQGLRKEIRKKKNRKQLVLVRAFGAILISTTIVWIPTVIHVVNTFIFSEIPLGFYSFAFLSFIMHSVLDPVIEGCFIPEIKMSFKKVLGIVYIKTKVKKMLKRRKESLALSFNLDLDDEENGRCTRRCCELFNIAALPESLGVEKDDASVPGSPTIIET
jgi:hypothetical protein